MKIREIFGIFGHSVSFGLALAFIIVLIYPELLPNRRPVVAFQESRAPPTASVAIPVFSYTQAVEAAAPAVVNIYTTQRGLRQPQPFLDNPLFRHFFDDPLDIPPEGRLEINLGSGVIVNPQGYVLTNYHVIENARSIQIALRDGRTALASTIGSDPDTDLAVLHIDIDTLPSITIGQSANLRIGDVVLAIGNPFGVGQTVTLGIVSATGRDQLGLNTFEDFIQTDAAINPGSSGGALINPRGELVGINTAIFSRSGGSLGIGFAIPADLAKEVLIQIIERGQVMRGWLGINVQDITPILAESFALGAIQGVLIAGVQRDGPAHQAGLMPGDVITRVQGQSVIDSRRLLSLVAQIRPGTSIRVEGIRSNESFSVIATVQQRPPTQRRIRG